ncbi:uncharacterized protein [Anabrus simplex]|uniref:uncharacterized protein isoform X2 n=1 Tax=Anabrus simplex TaxID=316456 RepID=UPI0035A30481
MTHESVVLHINKTRKPCDAEKIVYSCKAVKFEVFSGILIQVMKRKNKTESSSLSLVSEYFPATKATKILGHDSGEKQEDDVVSVDPNAMWALTAGPKQAQLIMAAELEGQTLNGNKVPSVGLNRLPSSFYDVPCEVLARALLGKVLVRRLDDGRLIKGRIVETECYLGGEDKASHSYNGKVTSRNTPMFMKPGTIYVYFTYGMYYCFNISSRGDGAAVLVRALEPLEGIDYMYEQRTTMKKTNLNTPASDQSSKPKWKLHELCNGPSKLCRCLNISTNLCNKRDLSVWDGLWIESDNIGESVSPHLIITSTRIGIDSAGLEWASKPLRFYLFGYKSVSRLDKKAEQLLHDSCMQ